MNEETSLIGFKAICNFIADLESVYGKRHKPLKLYNKLASHTRISHTQAINKHNTLFQNFCITNRDAILTKDISKITQKRIEYSERVYIDMGFVFSIADNETLPAIWQHLLTISAILDPTGNAKEILRKNVAEGKTDSNEADFLNNIITKVEQNVKPGTNPMEAVTSIMQSGIFTELLTNMQGNLQSGKMDIRKLLGAVQNVVSNLNSQSNDPETKQMAGVLNNVSTMVENMSSGAEPPNIMQMMSTIMSGINKNDIQK